MKAQRIFLAGLFHETNTFAPGISCLSDFSIRRGDELLNTRGDGSPMAAFVEFGTERGWEIVPSIDLRLAPGPMVADEVLEFVDENINRDLSAALDDGIDAVFLVLHGAMVSETCDDVEGHLLEQIARRLQGRNVPVVAVLDLHANVSPRMAENADILLSYQHNPHTDAAETALRAAHMMERLLLSGTRSSVELVRAPIVWPPTGTATGDEPMAGLLKIARQYESGSIHAISVCPGFAHADTPWTGLTFSCVIDANAHDHGTLASASRSLVEYAIKNAPSGCPAQWKLLDAIADLVERREFPALLVEPADNIGGGAPGDATWILEALVQSGTELKSGIIINDPDAAAKLHALNVGESTTVPLGGDFPSLSGPCIEVPLKLLKKIDGKFTVEDLHSHIVSMCGSQIEMGPTALASYGNILILVTTHKTPPMDLGQWRCVGVDPADFEIIGIKAAVAHRQAYDRISRRSYTVSTPGCCTSDLKTLSYHNVERPAFPLEGK